MAKVEIMVTCCCCGAKTLYEATSMIDALEQITTVGCEYCFSNSEAFMFGFLDGTLELGYPITYVGLDEDGVFHYALNHAQVHLRST